MPEITFSPHISFSLSDLITTLVAAAILYAFKRGFNHFLKFLPKLFIGIRRRELKKIKRVRSNRYEVQRQIAKEGAYFTVFLASGAVSIGLSMLLIGSLPDDNQLAAIIMIMAPVLIVEILWLKQQAYVLELTRCAAKLPPNFKAYRKAEKVSSFRSKLQRERRKAAVEQ